MSDDLDCMNIGWLESFQISARKNEIHVDKKERKWRDNNKKQIKTEREEENEITRSSEKTKV